MLMLSTISVFISILLIKINSILMVKKNYKEKISTFECGFDPKSEARLPFSMHFFLIAVIFLIFDVEITMILPMPMMNMLINKNMWTLINMTFLIILVVGTFHEWKEGALNWAS
uniref:NADH-ubiquinone oxidoreductase chain 3 n=1 Tax=Sminthurinus signatus TaxID=2584529 RepID=A0A6H0EXS6_9HEXA|nr:NADH dehydrogenase subunit 3 [Sminthurinus signatus]